jgi:hypothetical protein
MMVTVWNCWEGSVFIYLTIYYYYISKNWVWTQWVGAGFNVVACILLLWLPESPKYLYSEKRYKECIDVLQQMKKVNTGNSRSNVFTSLIQPDGFDEQDVIQVASNQSTSNDPLLKKDEPRSLRE